MKSEKEKEMLIGFRDLIEVGDLLVSFFVDKTLSYWINNSIIAKATINNTAVNIPKIKYLDIEKRVLIISFILIAFLINKLIYPIIARSKMIAKNATKPHNELLINPLIIAITSLSNSFIFIVIILSNRRFYVNSNRYYK